jgi:hypothetical protein
MVFACDDHLIRHPNRCQHIEGCPPGVPRRPHPVWPLFEDGPLQCRQPSGSVQLLSGRGWQRAHMARVLGAPHPTPSEWGEVDSGARRRHVECGGSGLKWARDWSGGEMTYSRSVVSLDAPTDLLIALHNRDLGTRLTRATKRSKGGLSNNRPPAHAATEASVCV